MKFFKDAETIYKEMTSTMTDVDTGEHSLIYNADKPVSYELSYQTMIMDEIKKMMFAESACNAGYSQELAKKCADLGVDKKLAKYSTGIAKVTGRENSKLPGGTMVSTPEGLVYYTQADLIIDNTGIGYVSIQAKEKGSKYNVEANSITIFPAKYNGIISVTNEKEIKNGYNDESDYELLQRYFFKLRTITTSGNVNHYKVWTTEVDGVGSCKVFETTNELRQKQEGHVLVVITDANRRKAEQELLDKVYKHIEEERPVGAKVHILSIDEKALNISAKLDIDKTSILSEITKNIKATIEEYLQKIDIEKKYISYAKIGSLIFSVNGVNDYTDLKINDGIDNIPIGNIEVPVLGTTQFSV